MDQRIGPPPPAGQEDGELPREGGSLGSLNSTLCVGSYCQDPSSEVQKSKTCQGGDPSFVSWVISLYRPGNHNVKRSRHDIC